MPNFHPVKTLRISENITTQLKNAILKGEFQPGEKLPSERELTQTFQASRVVVREALRALELAGFVNVRQGPHGGAYIQRLGYERLSEYYTDLFLAGELSVRELVQARVHLQPEIVRLAAENLTPESAARLEQALAREQGAARKHADWVRRNMATDYVLMEMCGNRLFQAMLDPLLRLTQEIVLVVKPRRTVIHDPREHEAIVDAVLSRDGRRAGRAMREHIENVGRSLIGLEEAYRRRKGLK
jgi:DNA-binding FadR family transcriptional regulator